MVTYIHSNVCSFVDDLDSADELDSYSPPPFMCLIEEPRSGRSGDVNVATITICPSTGDVVWDDFEGMVILSSAKSLHLS